MGERKLQQVQSTICLLQHYQISVYTTHPNHFLPQSCFP